MTTVAMSKSQLLIEHKRITKLFRNTLKSLNKLSTALEKELNIQQNELSEYGGKKKKTKKQKKIHKIMKEYKNGKLKNQYGSPIRSRKQAIAVALNYVKKMD